MSTSRLQSEVDVLIIDFEKVIYQNTKEKRSIYFIIETYWSIQADSTTWEMQKRSKQLELINIEFKSKLD
jgi:hypothetical protein